MRKFYSRCTSSQDHVDRFNLSIWFCRRSKLFRFSTETNEWKERGTGDVRLLQHKESKKVRLVMRRDKTYKVCANHLSKFLFCSLGLHFLIQKSVSSDMRLQLNVGSDRSWVWKVAADYSEDPPTSETLAIRFANSESGPQFQSYSPFRLTSFVRCRAI
jgi:Ran-binding protein 1